MFEELKEQGMEKLAEAELKLFEQLEKLKKAGMDKISETSLPQDLQTVRANLLGRKGEVTEILKSVGQAAPELRKILGQAANEVKEILSDAIEQRNEEIINCASCFQGEADITLPGVDFTGGGLHPITQMC